MLHYFTLKSDSKLPTSAKFIDPYDHEEFFPGEKETLVEFTDRIRSSRAHKKAPEPTPQELRALVIECLYETAAQPEKVGYFNQQSGHPTLQNVFSAARSIVNQIKHPGTIPLRIRQARAKFHCLNNCALHNRSRAWSPRASSAVMKAAGIEDLGTYPEEKMLGTCGMCGCGLAAKLKFTADAALAGLLPDQIDILLRTYGVQSFSRCWILKELLQNPESAKNLRNKLAVGQANGVHLMNDHVKLAKAEKDGKEKT